MRVELFDVAWVRDLQVLHLQFAHIIHRYFEGHLHWADLFPELGGSRCWKRDLRDQEVLVTPLELFDLPDS